MQERYKGDSRFMVLTRVELVCELFQTKRNTRTVLLFSKISSRFLLKVESICRRLVNKEVGMTGN